MTFNSAVECHTNALGPGYAITLSYGYDYCWSRLESRPADCAELGGITCW